MQQGRVAAQNIAGTPTPFTGVPFFWTTQFDATLNYVGHANGWDETIIQGNVADRDFLVFYVKDKKIMAVAGMNRDRELAVWKNGSGWAACRRRTSLKIVKSAESRFKD